MFLLVAAMPYCGAQSQIDQIWVIILLAVLITLLLLSVWQSARHWREMRATKEKDPAFLLLQQQIDSLRDQVSRVNGNLQSVNQ